MIIDGKYVTSQRVFDVYNPFSKEKVGTIPVASADQVQKALRLSYETKPKLTGSDRAKVLRNVSNLLLKNKRNLAELITSEAGLCIKDTMHEIDRVSNVALCASTIAEFIEKDTTNDYVIESQEGRPTLKVITEPMDLVVGITPFNHPMNQVAHKVFPAIAAGTCLVLRPSSKTPLSAIKLGQLLIEAGLAKNMLNIVTDDLGKAAARQMITSPLVDMVTFTGGLEAGLDIARKMADSGNILKKYVSELGGCSALIVNDDADIERSARETLKGCFKNSGQRCTAIRMIIVIKSVAEIFVKRLVGEVEKLKYGDPYDETVDMGTVISEEAAIVLEERVSNAIKDGADLLLGNKRDGALYSPTVLDNVNIDSELVSNETFGPIAPIIRVENLDEAISFAKKTGYRLAGAVMTKKREIAEKVSNELIVGQFSWNGFPSYRTEAAPFGGFKNSGNGEKEGAIPAAYGMRRIRTFYEH